MTNGRDGARWMIGVDVGGTKVAAGFVNGRGEMGEPLRVAMNPRGTAEEGFAAVRWGPVAVWKRKKAGGRGAVAVRDGSAGAVESVAAGGVQSANVPVVRRWLRAAG